MASFNKVILMGNLTRDPELRYTPSGMATCRIGIATSRKFMTKQGEPREETCFVDVDVWDRQAQNCSQYLRKGSPVFIEGRLRYDQWDDKATGQKRSRLLVHAETVQFLAARPAQGGAEEGGYAAAPAPQPQSGYGRPAAGGAPAPAAAMPPPPQFEPVETQDDDIPF